MFVIMATVDQYVIDGGWWYLSCVCHEQVVHDSRAYYCERCNKYVLMITLRKVFLYINLVFIMDLIWRYRVLIV